MQGGEAKPGFPECALGARSPVLIAATKSRNRLSLTLELSEEHEDAK